MVILNRVQIATGKLRELMSKNSTTILTAVGVGGVITTAGLIIKATPKVMERLSVATYEKQQGKYDDRDKKEYSGPDVYNIFGELTRREMIEACWKEYIPAAVMGTLTIGCIIGANSIHTRRQAALASLYSATEKGFREYQDKVKEQIGESKELKIKDGIAKDKIEESPPDENSIILTGKGDVTCFDSFSGRYFKSDIESIRKIVNDLTEMLWMEDFVPINSFYHEVGLDGIKMGEETGWLSEDGVIDFHYSSQLTNGEPVLVIDYTVRPYTRL